ncbi:MAG: hypothetical protein ACRD1N_02320 [Terriglobia bacterium]
MRRLEQHSSNREGAEARSHSTHRIAVVCGVAALAVALLLWPASPAQAQFGNAGKLPGISKITSNGPTRQAFSGSVQSLDRKQHVLNVISEGNSAIFPIKKKVKVTSVGGAKMNLTALTPGTSVLIYYEQKGGRRTVDQILVLESPAATASKKKPHASS